MNEKNKYAKVLKTIAAAGAVSAVGAYSAAHILVKIALDRNKPRFMKNSSGLISGSKKDGEIEKLVEDASKKLEEQPHKIVSIRGEDGVKLTGRFFPCKKPKRLIIAFHGWRSSWSRDYGIIYPFWQENNCSILYAEQRGQNNSEGEYMGFGLSERFDCARWAKCADKIYDGKVPVYLAGISMGASTVLMASDLEMPKSVCGIMADCGFTSPDAIFSYIAKNNLHMTYRFKRIIADYLFKRKINMKSGEYSTVEALKKTDIPVLFIHGTDDTFVPVTMTYENYKACNSPKRLLIVPGANHAVSYLADENLYREAVLSFWKSFDGYKRGSAK